LKIVADVAAGTTAIDEKIGARKRIIVRGGKGAARKVVRDRSAVFSFSGWHGFFMSNPVERASVRNLTNALNAFCRLGGSLPHRGHV
jgi:hypothetical protein